jgi:hypothetical protein
LVVDRSEEVAAFVGDTIAAGACAGDGAALLAFCEVTDVAAVDDRASDRAVDEVVDRFLSNPENDGECEKSFAESFAPNGESS